ncbi:hypothetical protein FF38_02986 [Lucilia cuprina]|uniref:Uncharacterized protein n=1 Tax=Lucilia cuprina TaxID=7375 RepID=A0A0L0CMV8_LUCCU|nr:hypothetical protein FF38_02986 [Lucilia cuprina]
MIGIAKEVEDDFVKQYRKGLIFVKHLSRKLCLRNSSKAFVECILLEKKLYLQQVFSRKLFLQQVSYEKPHHQQKTLSSTSFLWKAAPSTSFLWKTVPSAKFSMENCTFRKRVVECCLKKSNDSPVNGLWRCGGCRSIMLMMVTNKQHDKFIIQETTHTLTCMGNIKLSLDNERC